MGGEEGGREGVRKGGKWQRREARKTRKRRKKTFETARTKRTGLETDCHFCCCCGGGGCDPRAFAMIWAKKKIYNRGVFFSGSWTRHECPIL